MVRETLIDTLRATIEHSKDVAQDVANGNHRDSQMIKRRAANVRALRETITCLQGLPDDDPLFELVDGRLHRPIGRATFTLTPRSLKRLRTYGVSHRRSWEPRLLIELLVQDEEQSRDMARAAKDVRDGIASIHAQLKKLRRYATIQPELVSMAEVEDVADHLDSVVEKLDGG